MEPATLTLWICLGLNYAIVATLLARGFSRHGGIQARMRLLGLIVAACGATTIVGLLGHTTGIAATLGACVLFTVSTLLTVWAWLTLRTAKPGYAFSGHRPLRLVCNGPYRWIRHPLYTSYLSSAAAGCICTGSMLTLAMVVLLAGFYAAAARDEERVLAAGELGATYVAYRSATGAFLPRWNQWSASQARRGRLRC